jgi:hypothetical protein
MEDLASLTTEELQRRVEELQRAEYITILQGQTSAMPFRKHARVESTIYTPPPKRPLLSRLPTKDEQYHTTTYANYCEFTRKMQAFGNTNGYTEEDLLHLAVLYLDSTLQGLWSEESAIIQSPTWDDLREFLLRQLGDPADRLHTAWSKALRMRCQDGESDYAYLQRWREQWSELGEDGQNLDTILLRIFFESYPQNIKQKVREQSNFPTTLADLVSLITKLRPSISTPTARSPTAKKSNEG